MRHRILPTALLLAGWGLLCAQDLSLPFHPAPSGGPLRGAPAPLLAGTRVAGDSTGWRLELPSCGAGTLWFRTPLPLRIDGPGCRVRLETDPAAEVALRTLRVCDRQGRVGTLRVGADSGLPADLAGLAAPLRLMELEVSVTPGAQTRTVLLRRLQAQGAVEQTPFDPSVGLEWDLGPRTIYRMAEDVRPTVRIRARGDAPLQVQASLRCDQGGELWRGAATLAPWAWTTLPVAFRPPRHGLYRLELGVTPSTGPAAALVLALGVDGLDGLRPNPAFGVNSHYARSWVGQALHPLYQRMFRELGASSVRMGLLEEPRFYDLDSRPCRVDEPGLDALVQVAEGSGLRVHALCNLLGMSGVVRRQGGTGAAPLGDLGAWAQLHRRVAERYRGKVESYELLNERDNGWNPRTYAEPLAAFDARSGPFYTYTIAEEAAASNAMTLGLRAGDPGALVVAQGIGYRKDEPGPHPQFSYNRRLDELGVARLADRTNLHLYGWLHFEAATRRPVTDASGGILLASWADALDDNEPAKSYGFVPSAEMQMAGHGVAALRHGWYGRPVWVTETGQPGPLPRLHPAETHGRWVYHDGDQAAALVRIYALLLARGAERVFWYEDTDATGIDPGLSLYDQRYCPKASALAHRLLAHHLAGARLAGCLPGSEPGTAPVFSLVDGRQLAVVWGHRSRRLAITPLAAVQELDLAGNGIGSLPAGSPHELDLDHRPRLLIGSFPVAPWGPRPLLPPEGEDPGRERAGFIAFDHHAVLASAGEEVELPIAVWAGTGGGTVEIRLALPDGCAWSVVAAPPPVVLPAGEFVCARATARLRAPAAPDHPEDPADLLRRPRLTVSAIRAGRAFEPVLQDLLVLPTRRP